MTKEQRGFWYNLGLEVGGPLYLDLYRWLFEKTAQEGKRVYFLAPGGYNLYRIFEKQGVKNISYLSLAQDLLKSAVAGDCRAKEEMLQYLEENQFLQQDSLCFEWGWQGTIQTLLEQFKGIIGNQSKQFFLYYGIENSDVSRAQVRGMHYDTYLFDFYKNYSLQADAAQNKNSATADANDWYKEDVEFTVDVADADSDITKGLPATPVTASVRFAI